MSDPISFDSASPRFGLPLLFAGQAQKEFYVNEAYSRIDALMHGAIEDMANDPPAAPVDGTSWLVDTAPTGSWTGHSGMVASRQGGNWLFTPPCDGMRLFNRATGQEVRFAGSWRYANRPASPSGGSTIDSEARVAILQLIDALVTAGIFSAT